MLSMRPNAVAVIRKRSVLINRIKDKYRRIEEILISSDKFTYNNHEACLRTVMSNLEASTVAALCDYNYLMGRILISIQ